MMFLRLLINQARYKWGVTSFVFLAMAALVTLYVYLLNADRYVNRSMQIITKKMGHNMLLFSEESNALDVHLCADEQALFDDDVTRELAKHLELASKYYVTMLQRRVEIEGHELLLSGIELVARRDESAEKGNLIKPLKPGEARLGSEAAAALAVASGDTITVLGETFTVKDIVAPQGDSDDYRVYIPLDACQRLFGLEGRANAILAFMCLSHGGSVAEIDALERDLLSEIAPGIRHVSQSGIGLGRFYARQTTSRFLACLLGLVLAVTVCVIVITTLQEVSERRREIGVFAAMGTGYVYIVALYLSKMLALALAAALGGFLAGSKLAVFHIAPFVATNTQAPGMVWNDLPSVIGLTCLVSLISMIPAMVYLVRHDPNRTLAEE